MRRGDKILVTSARGRSYWFVIEWAYITQPGDVMYGGYRNGRRRVWSWRTVTVGDPHRRIEIVGEPKT